MIIHKNFMTMRRNANPYAGNFKQDSYGPGKLISRKSAVDQLDISEEALTSFRSQKIFELERARIKKTAQELRPLIQEQIGKGGDQRNLVRLARLSQAREKIREDANLFDNSDITTETAERILSLLWD